MLKFKIGAKNANMSGSFVPFLGQAGLNMKEFCDRFNVQTQKYYDNLPVIYRISVIAPRKYEVISFYAPLSFFIKYYVVNNTISWLNFYKIMKLWRFNLNNEDHASTIIEFFLNESRVVFGVIKSMKIKIID